MAQQEDGSPDLERGPEVSRSRDVRLSQLLPFLEECEMLILVEPKGGGGASLFRLSEDGERIERPGHQIELTYRHHPERYVSGVKVTRISSPGE